MKPEEFIEWIIANDEDTNHWYDRKRGVQYKFHLHLVAHFAAKFKYLLKGTIAGITTENLYEYVVRPAAYAHDSVEDSRLTYNDIVKRSNHAVADICAALTNAGYGKNRAERMPPERYQAILNTPYAVYVKLCDRIANVTYSNFWGEATIGYGKEQQYFKTMLYDYEAGLDDMWDYLEELLNKANA